MASSYGSVCNSCLFQRLLESCLANAAAALSWQAAAPAGLAAGCSTSHCTGACTHMQVMNRPVAIAQPSDKGAAHILSGLLAEC